MYDDIQECHHNVLEFEFSSLSSISSSAADAGGRLSLSNVFSTMEDVCRDLSPSIDHYSLSQNTLDNVSSSSHLISPHLTTANDHTLSLNYDCLQ